MNKTCSSKSFKSLMILQFFGAFNDNAFKLIISFFAVNIALSASGGNGLVSFIGALFIIPFILFSTYAGFLADRFSKRSIIIWIKIAEIAIMVLGFFALLTQSLVFMLVVLFLMATQSAFFSPAKYGILPEMLDDAHLSKGNGYIQLWTFIAIIIGTAASGFLKTAFGSNIAYTSLFLIAFAVIGAAASIFVQKVPVESSKKKFTANFLKDAYRTTKQIKKDKALFLTLLALSYFWFLGSIFLMNSLIFVKKHLVLSDSGSSLLLAMMSIGIGVGSVLAGRWSGKKVEFGLVPLGSIGVTFFCFLLGLPFRSQGVITVLLFFFGVSAGFFAVPLNAFFQQKSPAKERGSYLAALNIISNIAMLAGSLVLWLLGTILPMSAPQIFLILSLTSAGVTLYIFRTLPDSFLRFVNWLMTHSVYKIRVLGEKHVPETGGALLVCNHVSYVDPLVLLASIQRNIRFMMYRPIYKNKVINPLAKIMKAIPISMSDSPKKIMASLQEAREAVNNGDLVCIFAEGKLTRIGNMLPFNKGFEHIMKGVQAPIIPVHIDCIWGSIFSYEGGKYFWKRPKRIPYPVTVSYGRPMQASSNASEVRIAVQELSAEAFKLRGSSQKKLHCAFIDEAKRHPFQFCMADSTGLNLNYGKVLASAMMMANKLFPGEKADKDNPEMVGIMLPSSCMGSLANGAAFFAGKIPVNLNFTASAESIESAISQCNMKRIITSKLFLKKLGIEPRKEMIFLEDSRKNITKSQRLLYYLLALILPASLIRLLFVRGDKKNINDVATIIFSSGSTGEPKGVMLTHGNIFSNIEGIYQVLKIQKDDIILGTLPFFHSFGFTATMCFPVGSGIGVVYHTNPLDASTIGNLAEQHKATVIMGTPTFFSAYLRKCTEQQFKTVRIAIAGAEKLKKELAEKFSEKFGVTLYEGYGATELSPIVSLCLPDFTARGDNQTGYKSGTVGHPIPGVAVKTVDLDTFEDLPYNEAGMLLVKGANVMKGYLGNDEKTKEVIKNGWYITGDIARIDTDGFIHITDRLSRFSKIGGEMVPHIKIEEELLRLLGTTEQICAVTAVPDERKGEKLVVLHKDGIDPQSLCQQLTESSLPNLWVPKKENFFEIEEIPVLGSGKLDLKKIKQLAKEITGS